MEYKTKHLITKSPHDTERFAAEIATRLSGGEVIELVSDLGGGKTTFTRGLVAGLDSHDNVASPTFTISKEYTDGRLNVYHFDFYRLGEAGLIADELAEIVGDQAGVVVVEWAGIVEHVLPKKRFRIEFSTIDETTRKLTCVYPTELAYIAEGIQW